MRMKRIEESKSNGVLFEFFEDDFQDQDDGLTRYRTYLIYRLKWHQILSKLNYIYLIFLLLKSQTDDLEAFLGGIRMKNLISLFKTNRVNLKKLLNYKIDDLKKVKYCKFV